MFNKGQLAGLMKQAQAMQEKMQQQMAKIQEDLAAMDIEGQAGAGMVRVVMSGNHSVKRVAIDASLLADDKEMLEDLIAAAFNDAARKADAAAEEKKGALSAGMGMPAGFKMPF
ncbi:MAG: YbaB/EbfC family nucleoid-associated protein [Burkholderiales bacterium]|nr:YbaB/EbfC family nucleoid-associated protein [Burkholderiales bacterium]